MVNGLKQCLAFDFYTVLVEYVHQNLSLSNNSTRTSGERAFVAARRLLHDLQVPKALVRATFGMFAMESLSFLFPQKRLLDRGMMYKCRGGLLC